MTQYSVVPMTLADLPLFRAWLDEPQIEGWWGDSQTEARLVEEDMGTGKVDMRLALCQGAPFAYIQDDNAHAFEAPHDADQPAQARAIDTFLGKGHGAGSLAARLAELRATCPAILTDPYLRNTRAIAAACGRAGVRPLAIRPCEDGNPVQVMVHL